MGKVVAVEPRPHPSGRALPSVVIKPDGEDTWVDGLPNIIAPWLEQTGEEGKTVLKAYFAELRKRGAEPLRAWDEGL